MKGILQVGDAWVEVGRVKWEEQLGVVSIKVVVKGKGWECWRGSVDDKKQRTDNGALRTPQEEV